MRTPPPHKFTLISIKNKVTTEDKGAEKPRGRSSVMVGGRGQIEWGRDQTGGRGQGEELGAVLSVFFFFLR